MVLVLSDLLDEDDWLAPLRVHAARGRDVWLLHVVDPAEQDFPYEQPACFVGLEGEEALGLDPRRVRSAYRAAFAQHLERIERSCLDAGLHYVRLNPAEGPIEPLRRRMG